MIKKCIEFFYGRECPDCLAIIPAVKRLIAEDGVEITKREVWPDAENHQRMENIKELYEKNCEGNFVVPSFYDKESDRLICNPDSYENLKQWIFQTRD